MKNFSIKALSISSAVAITAGISSTQSASALTISGGPTPTFGPQPYAEAVITDFDVDFSSSAIYQNLTDFDFQNPSGDGGADSTLRIAEKQGNQQSFAKFTFNDYLPYFGFEVLEISQASSFTISLLRDATQVFSTPLNNILSQDIGCDPSGSASCYVNLLELDNEKRFNMVVFEETSAGNNNLTILDNVAYKVPTPAMLPGLVGVGVAAYRKRREGQTQEG